MPAISIVMPVYNAQAYLSLAVESILKQTFSDFEFIIVNDGSTDRSLDILRHYAKSDNRIRLLSRPNTGIVGALNDSIRMASSELIARMDADDIAEPERLNAQLDFIKRTPDCAAVGSWAWIIDNKSAVVDLYKPPTSHNQIMAELLKANGGALLHPSIMVQKKLFVEVGAYSEEFCKAEDLDLYFRLEQHGRFYNLETPLLRYRQHLHSTNYKHFTKQRLLAQKILERERPRHGLPALDLDTLESHANLSIAERHQNWATKACKHGTGRTALRHALLGLYHAPLTRYSWKVLNLAARNLLVK